MRGPAPLYVAGMSAEEVAEVHARGLPWVDNWRDQPFSAEEILAELVVVLDDTARFQSQGARLPWLIANMAASLRDVQRPAFRTGPLGHLTGFFASWLVRRADREDYEASLRAAQRAAVGDSRESQLRADLLEFVEGYADGRIDAAEFTRRLKKPRSGRTRSASREPAPDPPVQGILLTSATEKLSSFLAEQGRATPRNTWKAFQRFAELPVLAAGPESVDPSADGDLLKFEWSAQPARSAGAVQLSLVRQLSILDADGDYDRMETVGYVISMRTSERCALEPGVVWSNESTSAWYAEVEQSPGFHVTQF